MPYKNLEDKRRWEREHRQQRNQQRKRRRLETQRTPLVQKTTRISVPAKKSNSGWGAVAALGLVLGFSCLERLPDCPV